MREDIQRILASFKQSKAEYLKINVGGELLEISKNFSSSNGKISSQQDRLKTVTCTKEARIIEVKSKNVGRYQLPKEGVLKEGQELKGKQILGFIDSMGLHHDIVAPCNAVVQEICVGNGDVVEFGQLLFIVKEIL